MHGNGLRSLALRLTSYLAVGFLSEEPSSKLPLDGYYNSESRVLEAAVCGL